MRVMPTSVAFLKGFAFRIVSGLETQRPTRPAERLILASHHREVAAHAATYQGATNIIPANIRHRFFAAAKQPRHARDNGCEVVVHKDPSMQHDEAIERHAILIVSA